MILALNPMIFALNPMIPALNSMILALNPMIPALNPMIIAFNPMILCSGGSISSLSMITNDSKRLLGLNFLVVRSRSKWLWGSISSLVAKLIPNGSGGFCFLVDCQIGSKRSWAQFPR
jgi:hypothetical protein